MRIVSATWAALLLLSFHASSARAMSRYSVGAGVYNQSSFGKTTNASDGSPGTLGAMSFPIGLMYSGMVSDTFGIAPSVWYTTLARSSGGGTAKTTMMHLSIPLTYALTSGSVGEFDVLFGPGLLMYSIQGAGGTKVLNNGTSTSTFGIPGNTASVRTLSADLGIDWLFGQCRLGLDFAIEGAASTDKRTINVALNFLYSFGGLYEKYF